MTDKLFKILKKEFPVFKSIERVRIYGAHERIYLNLIDKRFHKSKYFKDYDEIEKIANKIFDVPFVYEIRGDVEKSIFFKPRNVKLFDKQKDNYYRFVINVFNKFSEYAKR